MSSSVESVLRLKENQKEVNIMTKKDMEKKVLELREKVMALRRSLASATQCAFEMELEIADMITNEEKGK